MTGTLWHELAHAALVRAGLPFMQEVKLTRWPERWAGTADWVFFQPKHRAIKLKDFKTIKGDGLAWVERYGAKTEHLWLMPSYWHALYDMRLPLVEEFDVIYWPRIAAPATTRRCPPASSPARPPARRRARAGARRV